MAAQDVDAEIVEAVRGSIENEFGRYLGTMIGPGEASAVIEELARRGFVVVDLADSVATPEELAAAHAVTVNVTVAATPETLGDVLERVGAQVDAYLERG